MEFCEAVIKNKESQSSWSPNATESSDKNPLDDEAIAEPSVDPDQLNNESCVIVLNGIDVVLPSNETHENHPSLAIGERQQWFKKEQGGMLSSIKKHLNRILASEEMYLRLTTVKGSKLQGTHSSEDFPTPSHPISNYSTPGLSVIFNFKDFRFRRLRRRRGSKRDVDALKGMLEMFNCDWILYENISVKQVCFILKEISDRIKDEKLPWVYILILSHGADGRFQCYDGWLLIKDVLEFFEDEELMACTKIIQIQACRKTVKGLLENEESINEYLSDKGGYLLAQSTTAGCRSSRSKSQGSVFIQTTVLVFEALAHAIDVEKLFEIVADVCKSVLAEVNREQCPDIVTSLKDSFYLPVKGCRNVEQKRSAFQ